MARMRGSISMRLTLWFALLLGVFAITVVIVLWHLQNLKRAAENIGNSLQVATDAREIGTRVEELFAAQTDFVYASDIDYARRDDFMDICESVLQRLDSIEQLQPRAELFEIRESVQRMRERFLEQISDAKWREVNSLNEQEREDILARLFSLHQYGRRDVIRINELVSKLAGDFAIQTNLAVEDTRAAWDASLDLARFVFPAALLVSLLAIYYTYRSVARPVQTLTRGAAAIAHGNLTTRVPVVGATELREVAAGFNAMAHALEAHQTQLVDAEKMASVGRLAAGVAHEINNPLAVILGHAQMMMTGLAENDERRESLETIAEEARLCRDIVNSLLDLSRPVDVTAGELFSPGEIAQEVLHMMDTLHMSQGVDVQISVVDRPLDLAMSRGRMRQLLLNLVRNALEVLQSLRDGYLRIEGYVRPREKIAERMLAEASSTATSFLILAISDNGPGIPAQNIRRLFEPFYTTKTTGTGLGLAISYNIVRAHGGFIDVETAPAEGTTFTVGIPLVTET